MAVPVISGTAMAAGIRYVLSILLTFATLFACLQTYREWQIERVERLAADPATRADTVDAVDAGTEPTRMPPRMALGIALMQARVAAQMRSPAARDARIYRAEQLIDRALAARSGWGEAWIVATYVSLVGEGATADDTLAAFGRSLEITPYVISSAPWRIRYGASQWDRITPQTRERVLDEAQWFSGLAPSYSRIVHMALGTGSAASAFSARESRLSRPRHIHA